MTDTIREWLTGTELGADAEYLRRTLACERRAHKLTREDRDRREHRIRELEAERDAEPIVVGAPCENPGPMFEGKVTVPEPEPEGIFVHVQRAGVASPLHSEPEPGGVEPPPDCETCRHRHRKGSEGPCEECDDGINDPPVNSKWEPVDDVEPVPDCDGCRWRRRHSSTEPCKSCYPNEPHPTHWESVDENTPVDSPEPDLIQRCADAGYALLKLGELASIWDRLAQTEQDIRGLIADGEEP